MSMVDLEKKVAHGADSEAEAVSEIRLLWDDSVEAVPLGHGWEAEPVICDWFGRGEPDLLVSAGGGPRGRSARIYRPATAPGSFPVTYDEGADVEGLDGLRCLCPIPNQAPTRFDLVALDGPALVLVRNQGDADRPAFGPRQALLDVAAAPGFKACRIVQMVAEDWDGDGLIDLLVGLDDLTDYWPDGDTVPREQQVGFNQKGGHPGYDRAGRWRGRRPEGRLVWLKNVGSPNEPRFAGPDEIGSDLGRLDLATRPAPLTVAWGGWGSPELLVSDVRGTVRIYRNFGGQRPPVLMEPRTLRCGSEPLRLPDDRTALMAADLDGDRKAELIVGTSDGRVFAVHAGSSRDQARPPEPILARSRELWLGGHAVVAAGDLDGDGDLDLIVGDAPGRLYWVEDRGGPGDPRYAAPRELDALGLPYRLDPGPDGVLGGPADLALGYASPSLADWNDNGRLDLIVGGAGGEILFFRNNGAPDQPRFDRPTPLRCRGELLISPPRVRPAVADWFGTGEPGLITLDLQGFLRIFPREDTTDLDAPTAVVDRLGRRVRLDGGFGLAGRCALWAGPWTGSDQIDLLVGLPRGARHVIPPLTGRPLVRAEDLSTVLLLENLGHGTLIAREIRHANGRPLIVGTEGCSPNGVDDGTGRGTLDLLVGASDGRVHYFRRDDLRW